MAGNVANDPALVAKLVKLTSRGPTTELIKNLDVQMQTFEAGDLTVPLSISDAPNCYICSPTAAYIDGGLEEASQFALHPALRAMLGGIIRCCGPIVRGMGLDQQVQPNNWLFSTNPVPQIDREAADLLRDELKQHHPDRAIVIRSLNPVTDQGSIATLKAAGFQMLPARQIYLVVPPDGKTPSDDMKRDAKLLAETTYVQVDAHTFSAEDWTRAAMLYNMPYVEKHSALNPQYTPGFLAQAHQIGLLRIIGLRGPDDMLDGVVGMFTNGHTMTVPLIGYDTRKSEDIGLYRMLNAIAQRHATEHQFFYNLSAGAAAFKRHRNAKPAVEYTAVYVQHLGLRARICTSFVQSILTRLGIPIMQRYGT